MQSDLFITKNGAVKAVDNLTYSHGETINEYVTPVKKLKLESCALLNIGVPEEAYFDIRFYNISTTRGDLAGFIFGADNYPQTGSSTSVTRCTGTFNPASSSRQVGMNVGVNSKWNDVYSATGVIPSTGTVPFLRYLIANGNFGYSVTEGGAVTNLGTYSGDFRCKTDGTNYDDWFLFACQRSKGINSNCLSGSATGTCEKVVILKSDGSKWHEFLPAVSVKTVPAEKSWNGVAINSGCVGMWDTVSQKFYTNANVAGDFLTHTMKGMISSPDDVRKLTNPATTNVLWDKYFKIVPEMRFKEGVYFNIGNPSEAYVNLEMWNAYSPNGGFMVGSDMYPDNPGTRFYSAFNMNKIYMQCATTGQWEDSYSGVIMTNYFLPYAQFKADSGTFGYNITEGGTITQLGTYTGDFRCGNAWLLFGSLRKGVYNDNAWGMKGGSVSRIRWTKSDGTVWFDLYACVARNDIPAPLTRNNVAVSKGTCGFYDTVSGKFWANQNSVGSFYYDNDCYERISYLESTDGLPYINTHYNHTSTSEVWGDVSWNNYFVQSWSGPFGHRGGYKAADSAVLIANNTTSANARRINYQMAGIAIDTGTPACYYTIGKIHRVGLTNYNPASTWFDGAQIKSPSTVANATSPDFLFGCSSGTTRDFMFAGKIYWVKYIDNGKLQRFFLPCRLTKNITADYDSEGVARTAGALGMWDIVTNKFYGNVGTGTFVAES